MASAGWVDKSPAINFYNTSTNIAEKFNSDPVSRTMSINRGGVSRYLIHLFMHAVGIRSADIIVCVEKPHAIVLDQYNTFHIIFIITERNPFFVVIYMQICSIAFKITIQLQVT